MNLSSQEQLDGTAVTEVIVRERTARGAGVWSEMGSLYHSDSSVDISWFNRTGAQFTAATEKIADGPLYTFHQMGASAVTILKDRALVDSNCTVHAFTAIEGEYRAAEGRQQLETEPIATWKIASSTSSDLGITRD